MLVHTTPLNPTENGLVERSMQGINKIAAIAKLNKKSFQESLAEYVACYNTWPHTVTKVAPAELMFGRPVRTLLPNPKLKHPLDFDEELRERDLLAKFNRNRAEDERRNAGPTDLKVGDLVLVMQAKREKADSIYETSLHRIMSFEGTGRVTIMDQDSGRIFDRNVKHLKKFVERSEHQTSQTNTFSEVEGADNDPEEPAVVQQKERVLERLSHQNDLTIFKECK